MFGLFYSLANLLGITISGTKKAMDNSYYKQQGWEEYNNGTDLGKHTYYDAEGRQRDLTTNHIMFTYRENGDLFIEDTKTFRVRNLSEEKRNKEIQKAKMENPKIKAVYYKHWTYKDSELRDKCLGIPGEVYKDVDNGKLYFERYITWRKSDFSKCGTRGDFCGAYFYLRISDGKIESVSDKQIEKDKQNGQDINYDDFILFFNTEQDKGGFFVRNRNMYATSKTAFYLGNYSENM